MVTTVAYAFAWWSLGVLSVLFVLLWVNGRKIAELNVRIAENQRRIEANARLIEERARRLQENQARLGIATRA